MPYVRFLKDYQSAVTLNVFYAAGQVVDLPGRMSYALRTEGVVERVDPPPVVEPVEPEPVKKAASKTARKKAAPKLGRPSKRT